MRHPGADSLTEYVKLPSLEWERRTVDTAVPTARSNKTKCLATASQLNIT